MRRFLIDTDTASDDAVALIMALREKTVKVEAITVVAGNVPVDLAVKNALISVQAANTYVPPVYRGMHKPLLRELFTSEFVHGEDGMGNMDLPEPEIVPQKSHAVDAIIDFIMANPGEIEVVTLGPLTNLAMAYLKEPQIAHCVKNVTIMGSAGLGSGNITPAAEFNIFVDAEAASIVLNSGMPITLVGWDVSMGKTFIDEGDIKYLKAQNSKIADFCVRCNSSLQEFNYKRIGKIGFDLPDPTAVAVAIAPELVLDCMEVFAEVETNSEKTYGQVLIDSLHLMNKESNVKLCKLLDAAKFKEYLFDKII